MFLVMNTKRREHLCHIRGKGPKVHIEDLVLLNQRDYESRCDTADEVYDIVAIFSRKDTKQLIKSGTIPSWMDNKKSAQGDDEEEGGFEFVDDSDSDHDEESGIVDKRDKKNHRLNSKHAGPADDDSDVDIDAI